MVFISISSYFNLDYPYIRIKQALNLIVASKKYELMNEHPTIQTKDLLHQSNRKSHIDKGRSSHVCTIHH